MWFTPFVLLAAFSITKGGEVYDVTTIYDVGDTDFIQGNVPSINGRTHARTNALGLPLCAGEDDCIDTKDPQPYNITCDTAKGHCSWDTKDWTWTETTEYEGIKETKAYHINVKQTLAFKNRPEYSDKNYLYFTSGASTIRDEEQFFVVRFWRDNSGPQLFTGCRSINYNSQYVFVVKDRDGSSVRVYCASYYSQISFDYSNDYLTFVFTTNNFKIYRGLRSQSLEIDYSIAGQGYKEMKYFSVSGDNYAKFKTSIVVKVLASGPHLESQPPGLWPPMPTPPPFPGDMISPIFSPDSSQLCLLLVVHSPQDTRDDILHILAEDIYHTEHHLEAINNVKAGWNIKHANITLHKNISSPIKLLIRKVGSLEIQITRISTCSIYGEEVEKLSQVIVHSTSSIVESSLSNSDDSDVRYLTTTDYARRLPIYSAVSKFVDTAQGSTLDAKNNDCVNGGVKTPAGCACPPGFSGQNCQFGCGRNKFGQDCGGLCTFRLRECEGLLLCTNQTGCQCAPGYQGIYCNQECSPGRYGNGCSQQCGHCAIGFSSSSICDIYTGECSSCEPGYYPPSCKQAYVYYSLKPELSTPEYNKITVTLDPFAYVSANLKPELYQIQYREKDGEWRIYVSKKLPEIDDIEAKNNISETIKGLEVGVIYQVRVLLMDAGFNKYDGELVQVSEILTKCDIPEEYDYNLQGVTNSTSFSFSWSYVNDTEYWCPLISYEVSFKEGWEWSSSEVSQANFFLTGFLSGLSIEFRVRAKTSGGFAPYSKTGVYSTKPQGTSAVMNLQMVSSTSSSVEVSWEPPRDSNGRQLQYIVTYKCVEQPACSPGCHNATEGHLTVDKTSVTLSHLLPFAQYQVTVTPQDGLNASIYIGTSEVVPTEVPVVSEQKHVLRTNTSLTVFWDPVPVCSSFLLGYNYDLVKESSGLKMLANGFTQDTTASFHNLTASTEYSVRVYVLTVAGWNPESFLAIKTSTSATVPEAVRNLTVYKRGRNMLGVRWAAPHATYGALKSFTVRHELGQEERSHTVEPTPCAAWPDLYCYTIEALKASRRYNVTVHARNVDVPDDGVGASVTGVTKESPPSVPEVLQLVNSSSTSLGLEWRYPNLANGVLRSFLVSVEETEMYDQDGCCQVYPLMEIPVKEEAKRYTSEVSGLHPSSTYFVSVSAKTVGMGPSQSMVVYTRPPHLPLTILPQVVLPGAEQTVSWLAQEQLPEVNNSDIYASLIQAHLLLAVLNETQALQETGDSGVSDPQLDSLLQDMISKHFYFVSEYTQDEEVILSTFPEETDSTWGNHPSPSPLVEGQQYQLVAVQVTKYYDVFNADLRYSTPFTL